MEKIYFKKKGFYVLKLSKIKRKMIGKEFDQSIVIIQKEGQ